MNERYLDSEEQLALAAIVNLEAAVAMCQAAHAQSLVETGVGMQFDAGLMLMPDTAYDRLRKDCVKRGLLKQ